METRLDDFTVSISSIYDEPVFSSEGKRREQGRAAREETSEEETVRKGSQALDDPGLILAPGTLGNVWGNSTYRNEKNQESQLRPTSVSGNLQLLGLLQVLVLLKHLY
jgi:hypothetical protein